MESRSLPLSFYIRSARLLLKKATFSRKSSLWAEELRHLKKYSTLAFSVIPSHPEYQQENGRKLANELGIYTRDVRDRIDELEEQLSLSTSSSRISPSISPSPSTMSVSSGSREATEMDEEQVPVQSPSPRKKHIWEIFAKKLYEAAARSPCFPSKVYPVRVTAGTASSSSLDPDRQRNIPDVHEESSRSQGCLRNWAVRKPSVSELTNQILEDKVLNLQDLVLELRDSVEILRSRVEEEEKRWWDRADGLEQNIQVLKDETENEISGLKQQVQNEFRSNVDRRENQGKNVGQGSRHVTWESSSEGDIRVNQETQTMLMDDLEDKLDGSLNDLKSELKNDVNTLELAMSKDVDNLRQEMVSRFESFFIDVEMGRIGEQQQLETYMKHRFDTIDGEDVTKKIHALEKDLLALTNEVGQLGDEYKSGNGNLNNQLQCYKLEAMQQRVNTELVMKDFQTELGSAQRSLLELKCGQEDLKVDLVNLFRDRLRDISQNTNSRGDESVELVMERLQQFTRLYTGCLSDLQERMAKLETGQEEEKQEMERSLEIVENEKRLAAAAATEAVMAASQARDVLEELFRPKAGSKHRLKTVAGRLNRRITNAFGRFKRKIMVKPVRKEPNDNLVSRLNYKVHKLENVQMDHSRWFQEVHMDRQSLEKAASIWLLRLEATAKMLMEMETRVTLIELEIKSDETDKKQPESSTSSSTQTGELTRLENSATQTFLPEVEFSHSFHTGFLEVLQQGSHEGGSSRESTGVCCHERLDCLEDRVEHIATVTYANLRLLDSKLDHVGLGTRSALDIASEAEDKCSSLAAELVRVFKLMLSSKEANKKRAEVTNRGAEPSLEGTEEPVKRINLRLDDKGIRVLS